MADLCIKNLNCDIINCEYSVHLRKGDSFDKARNI